ncbi:MinD/ParA family ATP-binding protein [Streptomyces sp. NBC_01304]|uniref:MinD/ParA family ATP-binding protein n=1 Tax=Streptomyces sp. NBC_01304 TaxID=2903818 RepID=UPI002E14E277|nr:hypothetical protein OG430_42215 [Streptomyces sp. NBC_01304]
MASKQATSVWSRLRRRAADPEREQAAAAVPLTAERPERADIADVRTHFAGFRQIAVVSPKGGDGKTTGAACLATVMGTLRGGFVAAMDCNEAWGTLGLRTRRAKGAADFADMLGALATLNRPDLRVGELAPYVQPQAEAMFDVLASGESPDTDQVLTEEAFWLLRDIVSRFYKVLIADTGNNIRVDNWLSVVSSSHQLVITTRPHEDSLRSVMWMLDFLNSRGLGEVVSRAVTVITPSPDQTRTQLWHAEDELSARTRIVVPVPFDTELAGGGLVDFGRLEPATRRAWLRVAAEVAQGL